MMERTIRGRKTKFQRFNSKNCKVIMAVIFTPMSQHYPPGTQENYSNFPSRNLMMEKGKESEFPEGRGGVWNPLRGF
jgi:hypothetical protein